MHATNSPNETTGKSHVRSPLVVCTVTESTEVESTSVPVFQPALSCAYGTRELPMHTAWGRQELGASSNWPGGGRVAFSTEVEGAGGVPTDDSWTASQQLRSTCSFPGAVPGEFNQPALCIGCFFFLKRPGNLQFPSHCIVNLQDDSRNR